MLSLLNPFSWLLRFFDCLIILRSQLPLFLYCYFMKPLRLFLSISLMQAFLLLVWGTIQMRTRAQFSQSFRVFPQSFRDFPTEFSSRCKSGLRTQVAFAFPILLLMLQYSGGFVIVTPFLLLALSTVDFFLHS